MKNTLSLIGMFKRRVYRFRNDPLEHILAEVLEQKVEQNIALNQTTIDVVKDVLQSFKEGKTINFNAKEIASYEDIYLGKELNARNEFDSNYISLPSLSKVIHIIGSPRSGTTFLYNLLAFQGVFAYFSSISHYRWSAYNFKERKKKFLHELDITSLAKNTKSYRLENVEILPSESEDIFNRTFPVYKHIKGHEYLMDYSQLAPSLTTDELKNNILKHSSLFKTGYFLTKSPFNSFRIKQLENLFANTYFIHIYRNGYQTSRSIKDNGFRYFHPNMENFYPEDFWALHIEKILKDLPSDKTISISYEELYDNPRKVISEIMNKIQISCRTELILETQIDKSSTSEFVYNPLIEKFNKALGYKHFQEINK